MRLSHSSTGKRAVIAEQTNQSKRKSLADSLRTSSAPFAERPQRISGETFCH